MSQIPRHDEFRAARHGKLHQVVVTFVRQVRAPGIIDSRPFAAGKKNVHQFGALRLAQLAVPKKRLAAEDVLMPVEQRVSHQRHALTLEQAAMTALAAPVPRQAPRNTLVSATIFIVSW